MQKTENPQTNCIPTGFPPIDGGILSFPPSELIILASRGGYGQTTLALHIVRNLAVDCNIPIAYFSLDMENLALCKRLCRSKSEIEIEKLIRSPIWLDDTPSISIGEFYSEAKELVEQNGIRLIIVDYIQLMNEADRQQPDSVHKIIKALKDIAVELNICIIALYLLYREWGEDAIAEHMRFIREVRSFGQDADKIMLLDLYVNEEGVWPSRRIALINNDISVPLKWYELKIN